MEANLPLALRRTRRTSARHDSPDPLSATTAKTPRKTKKRVRFSDPGPAGTEENALSTGLTPMVRRTTLAPRRQSTPARLPGHGNASALLSSPAPFSGDMTFLPLRQVLDGRVQRRLRRNGLSEEMNTINQEKRRRARETREEVERLKAEVAEKDLEIYRLQNETIVLDTDRIWELEQQVADLRNQLADRSGIREVTQYDWTMAARDPFASDFMDVAAEEEFGDTTMADVQCSTPSRGRHSFPTPPATSPAGMSTPSSCVLPTPRSHAGVQASLPDPDKQGLEEELASLQLEVCKLNTTLESYQSLTTRLNDKLSPYAAETEGQTPNAPEQELETRLDALFRALSDRTAALLEVTSSLSHLGFPGNDASEIIASLASGFRAARLELEYLTPGELTLPLSSHGAKVLDLLLGRVRDLAKRAREDESTIDEYHEIELSLRQQLSARVTAMDSLRAELAKAQELLSDKNSQIAELEVGVDRLKGAVNGYVRDMGELEKLVETMEVEGRDQQAGHEKLLAANREVLVSKECFISELDAKLAESIAQTEALQKQVSDLQAGKAAELAQLNKQHGAALALRDGRVAELRGEIDRINESLRSAHETIRSLRVDKSLLETKVAEEKRKAKSVIDSMKEELQRVVRASQDLLETPKKQAPAPRRRGSDASGDGQGRSSVPSSPLAPGVVIKAGGMLSGDLARRQSTKKRRKYDSGLGFLDEDEVDV